MQQVITQISAAPRLSDAFPAHVQYVIVYVYSLCGTMYCCALFCCGSIISDFVYVLHGSNIDKWHVCMIGWICGGIYLQNTRGLPYICDISWENARSVMSIWLSFSGDENPID